MGDRFWSTGCRPDVEYFGYPGWGAHYRSRFGTFAVSGGVFQAFAAQGYECGPLEMPVKPYGWVAEMNYGRGCPGQWFRGGAVGFHDGRWNIMYGRYGQSALRVALRHPIRRLSQSSTVWPKPPNVPTLLPPGYGAGPPPYPTPAGESYIEGRLPTDPGEGPA